MSRQDLHTTEEWIDILKEQADYTKEYRHNLYKKVGIKNKREILDVGCGTGVITADIALLTKGHVTGIDIDDKKLEYAESVVPDNVNLAIADALELPFEGRTFDLIVFHVVLMHIRDQQKALNEMVRVTKKDGIVLAALEPDYAGELCYPENKARLSLLKHTEEMGVDLYAGRKLKYLFRKAGLKTEIGICDISLDFVNRDTEEKLKDFSKHFPSSKKLLLTIGWTEPQIEKYKQEMLEMIQNDIGFSFIPAFYAIGRK